MYCKNLSIGQDGIHNLQVNGFTLLEVLIAIIIFSVGLLGIAGLQVTGLKLSHDSMLRTTANTLAQDMADRIRANLAAIELGVNSPYNNPTGLRAANTNCLGIDSSQNPIDTQCTSNELALHDFYEWYAEIQGQSATTWHPQYAALLPDGSGIVCVDSTPNDGAPPPQDPLCDNVVLNPNKVVYTIKLWWTERKEGNATNHRFVTSFSP